MADDVFARLFAPVAPDAFFADHFEREPLHVARNDPTYFADVYGVADVEDALAVGAAQREHFTLVKDGAALPVAPDAYTVLAQFDRGHTLVISNATLFSPRLQTLCNRIGVRLGGFAVANAYFTPAGARGFDVHYDNHGTIVLQIAGSKRWRLYEPTVELPVDERLFTEDEVARLTPLGDVDLGPGDTLYLPQGVPHAGNAGERSLHVTLALRPARVGDLLGAALALATRADVELRRALPPGWWERPELLVALGAGMRERLAVHVGPDGIARAAERLCGERAAQARPPVRGLFDGAGELSALAPGTRLQLRDDAAHAVQRDAARVKLVVGERSYDLPASCGPLLARLRDGLTYADVQAALGGDADSFVKLLVLSGLLAVRT